MRGFITTRSDGHKLIINFLAKKRVLLGNESDGRQFLHSLQGQLSDRDKLVIACLHGTIFPVFSLFSYFAVISGNKSEKYKKV